MTYSYSGNELDSPTKRTDENINSEGNDTSSEKVDKTIDSTEIETSTEKVDETGQECTELVGYTEVRNFEACELLTNQEVAEYLRETIPPSHLENCPCIQYQPESCEGYPNALGTFYPSTHEICIWGSPERFEGAGGMLETVTHEIGHNAHENIMAQRPEIAERWTQLHQQSWETLRTDGTGFVSDYACTNECEDFAETYMTYIRDPEKLQIFNLEKYEFMKEVFSGREYYSQVKDSAKI